MIALIPARSGSKRIHHKNIRLLEGHPLFAYPIMTALQSDLFEDVYVSSDSDEYLELAENYGAGAIFRFGHTASDNATDDEWIAEALNQVGHQDFAILRPTNPFVTIETLHRAMWLFSSNPEVSEVRTLRRSAENPHKMWTLNNYEAEPLFPGDKFRMPTQSLPEVYAQAAGVEMRRLDGDGKILGIVVSEEEGLDINSEYDWLVAEHIAKKGNIALPRQYAH